MINIKTYSKPKEGGNYSGSVVTGSISSSSVSSSGSSSNQSNDYFYLDNGTAVCRYKLGTTENNVDLQTQIDELRTKLNIVYNAYVEQYQYVTELMNYVSVTSPHNVEIDGDLTVNGVIHHN